LAFIEWSDEFSVGVERYDGQHKRLIALLNELHEGMRARQGKEAVGRVLDGLVAYVRENYEMVSEFCLSDGRMRVSALEGTFLAWLDCRSLPGAPDGLARFFAEEAGCRLVDGRAFDPSQAGFMRLNLGCPRPVLAEALSRIREALDSRTGT